MDIMENHSSNTASIAIQCYTIGLYLLICKYLLTENFRYGEDLNDDLVLFLPYTNCTKWIITCYTSAGILETRFILNPAV